jgi:ATP-dependent DNA helicase RecQ
MVFYAQTGLCRWRVILGYFGERLEGERCGRCDNCRRAERREHDAATAHDTRRAGTRKRRPYAFGDEVHVPRFGVGRVRSTAGDEIMVEFPGGDARTFLRSYVRRAAHRARPVRGIARPVELEDVRPA